MRRGPLMKALARPVGWVAFSLLIAVAVFVSALRVLLAQPELLTPWVADGVAAASGEPVSFDSVQGRLVGLSPRVTLTGVRFGEPGRQLRFESMALDLDVWSSIWQARLVVRSVRLAGSRLRVTRYRDGRLQIQGRDESVLARMPLPRRIRLVDLSVDWRADGPEDEPLRLRGVSLQGQRADGELRLGGRARLADGGGSLRLSAVIEGGLVSEQALAARVHVAAAGLDARRLVRGAGPMVASLPALGGNLNGGLWLHWRGEGLVRATAAGQWQAPVVDGRAGPEGVSGGVTWRRHDTGWRVDAHSRGSDAAATRLSLARGRDKARWRLGVRRLPFRAWMQELLRVEAVPERLRRRLAPIKPAGELASLKLAHTPGDWRLEAKVSGVARAPTATYPGLDNVAVVVRCTGEGGQARLSMSDSRLRWPRYMARPLRLADGRAELNWRLGDGGRVQWHLADARFSGPRLAGRADGRLVPRDDAEPRLTGELRLKRADATGLLDRLKPSARDALSLGWLTPRLRELELTSGVVRASGPVSGLSFRDGGGDLTLRGGFRAGRLAYAASWPALAGAAGSFELGGDGLRVRLQRGSVGGLPLRGGELRLPNLDAPRIRVTAHARSDLDGWRGLLTRLPLPRPAWLQGMRLQGAASATLNLHFPLDGTGLGAVDGSVTVDTADVEYAPSGYRLRDLQGRIAFDRDGLSWEGVSARLAGQQWTSRGWTEGRGADARIRAVARADAAAGDSLAGSVAPDARVQGRVDWLLAASLPGFRASETQWRVELSSDLSGLGIDLPPPFGKAKEESRGLSLVVSGEGRELAPIRLAYGGNVRAVGALQDGRLTRAALRLGGEPAQLPADPGLRVKGRLGTLDVARLRRYAALASNGGEGADFLPPLTGLELKIARLQAGGYAVSGVEVGAEQGDQGWHVRFDGPNAVGSLRRDEQGGLDLSLKRLALERTATATELAPASPSQVPALEVNIDDLRLDERGLGKLRLRLSPVEGGMALRELTLDNPAILLRANGRWDRDTNRSQLELTAETVDVGSVLERFGAGRGIAGGHGRLNADLSWQGPLFAPDMPSLNGSLELNLREGSLPTVEPGAGRVFGLLSLSLLPRRLMLDFAPLTNEGLPFDRIRAAFDIEDGVARPSPCYLDGPMARIDVVGKVDLVERVYDQRIRVTPRISSSLPFVGALAGGPPAALLLLLGQDVVAEGMAPLTRFQYRLTGAWSEPRLRRVNTGLLGN